MELSTFLKESYSQEWSSLIPYLLACLITYLVTNKLSLWFEGREKKNSKLFVSVVTRILDISTYTISFIYLLIIKDMFFSGAILTKEDIVFRVKSFILMSIGIELAYVTYGISMNYFFLKVKKFSEPKANRLTLVIGIATFSLLMPPLKHFFTNSETMAVIFNHLELFWQEIQTALFLI